MFMHLSLRLRIFLFFAFLAFGGSALIAAGLTLGYNRLDIPGTGSGFLISGLVACAALIGLSTWVWILFDENVARPVERLAAEMRTRAHTDVEAEIDHAPARYLGDLAPAAAAVAEHLTETRNALALAVGRETAQLNLEKSRLEMLLAESPDGVLFCTPDHKVALYNARAAEVLRHAEALSLNRPIAHILMAAPIRQAYDRLLAEESSESADIVCATRRGGRIIEARLRLLFLEGQETKTPGYILSLSDTGADLKIHAERAALFNRVLDGVTEASTELPAPLAELIQEVSAAKATTDALWWPMEVLPISGLAPALRARLARKDIALTTDLPDRRIRCDGYAITRLLERLALGWAGSGATTVTLAADLSDTHASLRLGSDADTPSKSTMAEWLSAPLAPGFAGFSGRDVEVTHGTRVALSDGQITITLPLANPSRSAAPRKVQYDFDLLHAELPHSLRDAKLRQLNFVIFDTETTGLNPQVDEICQIAAVRVVNGKLRADERFDMLVNPGRKIPSASTAVHHITDEMVADAPDVATALTRFHSFADNAILVAHNAPFDMAFLQRREAEIRRRFDQPILDTVLLSAILFGQSAEHTLDAVCDRLAIVIPEEDRHTAIGDAIGTGDAFAKMIPMLEAADLPTLGATIEAFDRHSRLIGHLN